MPEVIECLYHLRRIRFHAESSGPENMDAYYNFHVNKLGQVDNIAPGSKHFCHGSN